MNERLKPRQPEKVINIAHRYFGQETGEQAVKQLQDMEEEIRLMILLLGEKNALQILAELASGQLAESKEPGTVSNRLVVETKVEPQEIKLP